MTEKSRQRKLSYWTSTDKWAGTFVARFPARYLTRAFEQSNSSYCRQSTHVLVVCLKKQSIRAIGRALAVWTGPLKRQDVKMQDMKYKMYLIKYFVSMFKIFFNKMYENFNGSNLLKT